MSNHKLAFLSLCIWTASLALLAGCSGGSKTDVDSSAASGKELTPVTLMLNWYPEAEHGGYYTAKLHGIFEKYGIDVTIRPGGPKAPVVQELLTGRVEFALGNADDVLLFRQQEAPVVALMAPIQNTPRCILVRKDSGVDSLSKLAGMTLQANRGRPFIEFLESEGFLRDVRVVPYSGSIATLASDAKSAIQAYNFSETLLAKQQGIEVNELMLSDIGFNPYASCLLTTEDMIEEQRDLVERVVQASQEGWQLYFKQPEKAHEQILEDNKFGMTAEALEFGIEVLRDLCITEEVSLEQVGKMSSERWSLLANQFVELELIDPDKVDAESSFSLDFHPATKPAGEGK